MNRSIMAIVLLLTVAACGAEPAPSIIVEAKLDKQSPATANDVVISVRVSCKEGKHELLIGSEAQVFGIYVLGPWGPVQPDLTKIRPENWMHQQHSAASRVVITPEKPFEVKLTLAEYFAVNDASAFRPGHYQLNIKFYDIGLGMSQPADSGAVTFDLPAEKPAAR